MKISQETYDETLLENEEVFSLSPSEAIKETISQFEQQGITNLSSYIVTSHPSSKEGGEERTMRSTFSSLLNKLDSFISSDGNIVVINDNDHQDRSDVIVDTINEIHGFYKYGVKKECHQEEKSGDTSTGTASGDINNNDPVPFLTMTHASSSIFTFMNLLSIIDLSIIDNNEHEETEIKPMLTVPTEMQQKILLSILKLLVTILSPKNKNEKEIKMMFKDSFVCMERMIGLILYHMMLVIQLQQSNNKIQESNNDEDATLQRIISSLTLLVKCTMNACKNCEKNKVLFVRCLKSMRVSESIGKVINCWISNYKSFLVQDGNMQSNDSTIMGANKKESTIGIICNLITLSLIIHKSSMYQSQVGGIITLMTECCTLISVLCRFDDFRSSEQTSESNNHASLVDSSYGGVSSAHDHVLEFNREGVIPNLHELILLALHQNKLILNETVGSGMNQDELSIALASSAMSATRVLAVNDEIVQALVAVGILKSIKIVLDMAVIVETVDDEESMIEKQEEPSYNVITIHDNLDRQALSDKKVLFLQRQQLATGAVGLIRNLCGNDEIKTTLCLGSNIPSTQNSKSNVVPSVVPSIVHAMSIYKKCATLQEHGCGALAAMALRKPSNASRIIHENGASSILTAMKLFPNNVLVQRQGALAIRNIVSRLVANKSSEDNSQNGPVESLTNNEGDHSGKNTENNGTNVRDIFLDLGAEIVLRGITGRHQGSVDEAYAALRDLGCQVSMLKYDAESQTAISRTVMFGDFKPQFRAVYDESG